MCLYVDWANSSLFVTLGKLPTLNLPIESHRSFFFFWYNFSIELPWLQRRDNKLNTTLFDRYYLQNGKWGMCVGRRGWRRRCSRRPQNEQICLPQKADFYKNLSAVDLYKIYVEGRRLTLPWRRKKNQKNFFNVLPCIVSLNNVLY